MFSVTKVVILYVASKKTKFSHLLVFIEIVNANEAKAANEENH